MAARKYLRVARAADTIYGIVIADAEHIVEEIALLRGFFSNAAMSKGDLLHADE